MLERADIVLPRDSQVTTIQISKITGLAEKAAQEIVARIRKVREIGANKERRLPRGLVYTMLTGYSFHPC